MGFTTLVLRSRGLDGMQQLGRSATLWSCSASYVRPASSCVRGQQAPRGHTGPQAAHRLAWGPSERAQLLRPAQAVAAAKPDTDTNQRIREGDTEAALVQLQVLSCPLQATVRVRCTAQQTDLEFSLSVCHSSFSKTTLSMANRF